MLCHCGLDLHFPKGLWCWGSISCTCWSFFIYISSLKRHLFTFFADFLIKFFLLLSCKNYLCYRYKCLTWFAKISSFVVFCFLDGAFWSALFVLLILLKKFLLMYEFGFLFSFLMRMLSFSIHIPYLIMKAFKGMNLSLSNKDFFLCPRLYF